MAPAQDMLVGGEQETQDHSGSEMLNVHFLKRTVCLSGTRGQPGGVPGPAEIFNYIHGAYPERQVRFVHGGMCGLIHS